MSLQNSEKIFVESKEEILELLDRIKASEKKQIILIVPTSSLLLSSIVNLKILFREFLKLEKNVILVTEDKYGFFSAQKAGFIVVQKLSQITNELWDVSFNKLIKNRNKIFSRNLNNDTKNNTNLLENFTNADDQVIEQKELENISEEMNDVDSTENNMSQVLYYQEDQNFQGSNNSGKTYQNSTRDDSEYKNFVIKRFKRVVNIDGVEIFGGGDIKEILQEQYENDKIKEQDFVNNMKKHQNKSFTPTFVGKDFTKYLKKESFFKKLKSIFGLNRKKRFTDLEGLDFIKEEKKNKRQIDKKFLFFVSILSLSFLVFLGYVFFDRTHQVDIAIKVYDEGVKNLNDKFVLGSILKTDVDFENLILPIVEYSVDKIGSSANGTTTGFKKIGNKSKGLVTIYNTTSPAKEIILPKGKVINNIGTGLRFVLLEDVYLDPPSLGSAGEINPSIKEDIKVEAEDIGEEYNLKVNPGSTLKFTVEGYQTTQVDVTGFTNFEGGSSQQVRVVSKDDYENLHKKLMQELEKEAVARLINLSPIGFSLIKNSTVIQEDRSVSIPDIDEITEDGNFSLNIEISIKGFFVRDEFLNSLARHLLILEKEDDKNIDIIDIKDVSLEIVSLVADQQNNFKLKLSSTGRFKVVLDPEEIKAQIKGLQLDEAENLLKNNIDIKSFRISYQPFFIPQNLRYIPKEVEKINIRFL